MTRFAEPNEFGYLVNIEAISQADAGSIRAIKGVTASLLFAIFAGSFFLGLIYLIVNAAIVALANFGSLSQPAKASALHHVLAIAFICYKWQSKAPAECERYFNDAVAQRALYNVVKSI